MRRAGFSGVLTLLLVAGVVVTTATAEPAQRPPNRLPTAKAGPILPSAAGIAFGRTTRSQLLRRWGRASYCWIVADGCAWEIRRYTTRGAYVVRDGVIVQNVPRGGFIHYMQFATTNWRTSRLRGWRTPQGIRIGSTYQALKRAHPQLRFNGSELERPNVSNWLAPLYTLGGNRYTLRFLVNRRVPQVGTGRVIRIEVQWFGPALACNLVAEAAPGPEGEPAGKRIHGSCSGAPPSWFSGRPVTLSFEPHRGAGISSITSPFDPSCSTGSCRARASDWRVDVTLGFVFAETGVDVIVTQPAGYRNLGTETLRLPFP